MIITGYPKNGRAAEGENRGHPRPTPWLQRWWHGGLFSLYPQHEPSRWCGLRGEGVSYFEPGSGKFWKKKQLDHRKKKLQLQLLSVIFLYIYIVFYYDLIIMIEYNILYLVGESRAPYPLPTNSNILKIFWGTKIKKKENINISFKTITFTIC